MKECSARPKSENQKFCSGERSDEYAQRGERDGKPSE